MKAIMTFSAILLLAVLTSLNSHSTEIKLQAGKQDSYNAGGIRVGNHLSNNLGTSKGSTLYVGIGYDILDGNERLFKNGTLNTYKRDSRRDLSLYTGVKFNLSDRFDLSVIGGLGSSIKQSITIITDDAYVDDSDSSNFDRNNPSNYDINSKVIQSRESLELNLSYKTNEHIYPYVSHSEIKYGNKVKNSVTSFGVILSF